MEVVLLSHTPFIFFWRVEFSAWRRSSSPSTAVAEGPGAAPSFRPWFSCSSCSICKHSWRPQREWMRRPERS